MRSSRSIVLVLGLGAMLACARIAGLDQGGGTDDVSRGSGSQNTPEGATIRPSQMTLSATCGESAESSPITIENGGTASVAFTVEASDPGVLGVLDASGSVVPKITGNIAPGRVSPGVKLRATTAEPGPHPTTVLVTVGDTQRVVTVDLTIQGGTIAITSPFDFGQVRQQTTSAQNVAIANTGTTTVTIDRWEGEGPDFTMAPGTIVLEPGQERTVEARMSASGIGPPVRAILTPHTVEGLCGAVPTLELKGQRVSTDVTVTGTVNFGDVECGKTAAQAITFTNYAQASADYTIQLAQGSIFSADPASGTIDPAVAANQPVTKTVNLVVNPQNVPGDARQEVIQVITQSNGSTAQKTVTATARIRGALIEVDPSSVTFDASNQQRPFSIKNAGNQFVYLSFAASGGFRATTIFDSERAGASGGSTLLMKATSPAGQATGEVTTTRIDTPPLDFFSPKSGVLCAPAPKITLTRR